MTDRVHALTVVLDRDIRTDDIEPLLTAISLLRGVASVASVRVDAGDYIARERARTALLTEILKALEPKPVKRTKAQRHVRKRAQIALAAAWKMLRKTGLPRKRQSQILTLVIANFAREGMGIPPHPWNYFDKEEDFPTIGGANQARMKRNAR